MSSDSQQPKPTLHSINLTAKDSTIIVIPHDITKPCCYFTNGDYHPIKDEIDILSIQRVARSKRIDSVDRTKSAITLRPLTKQPITQAIE